MKTINYNVEYKVYPLTIAEKGSKEICSPNSMHNALRGDYNAIQEELYLLLFDVRNRITKKVLISKGAYNSIVVTPRDILTQVLLDGKVKFAVAHNHPSGDVEPSMEDVTFTKKLMEAAHIVGLDLLDHVVFTDGEFHSMRQSGGLWE